jgi:hypothetical protein
MTVGPLRCTSERLTEMAGSDDSDCAHAMLNAVINRDVQLASDGRPDLVALHVDGGDGLARRKLGHLAE